MAGTEAALQPWWELRICVPRAVADDVAGLLVDDGALGVQTVSPQQPASGAWGQHPSMGPSHNAFATGVDSVSELEVGAGAELELLVSFAGDEAADAVLEGCRAVLQKFGLEHALAARTPVMRSDTDWAHAWRRHFHPTKVGRRLWIVPSWESAFVPPRGSVVLPLDPGMAFGTGQHATTALCLRAIERIFDAEAAPRKVLDVGCGSGILALGALALGADHATLIDTDPAAVRASEENLHRAGFKGRCRIGDAMPAVTEGGFDLVVANILAPVLGELSEALVAQVGAGGTLLLSGVLDTQVAEVLRAFHRAAAAQGKGAPAVQRWQHDAWVALQLRLFAPRA